MRVQPRRSATYLRRAITQIEAHWPGGMAAAIAAYTANSITLTDLATTTGVKFRALRRVLAHFQVERRSLSQAIRREHAINPRRREASKATAKRVLASPAVQAMSRVARRAAHLADPSKHLNAKVGMSKYEKAVAAALTDAGLVYEFNHPFPPFWLDFWLPHLSVGIEVQGINKTPSKARDSHIRSAGARVVFYFHTYQIGLGRTDDLIQVILDVQGGHLDPASLGEYTMISRRPHNSAYLQIGPHKFRWPFGPMYAHNCPPPPPVGQDYIAFPNFLNSHSSAAG